MKPEIRLSASIMAHPSRAAQAYALRDRLPELDPSVAFDPEPDGPPSALRAARVAWRAVVPGATHHLVLQEDVDAAPGLVGTMRTLVAARPADAVALMSEWGAVTAMLVRVAALHGAGWAPVVDPYVPTCGLLLPAGVARGFDTYLDSHDGDTTDDTTLAGYLAERGVAAYVAVPHPIGHDNHVADDSLAGNTGMGIRRSACPAGGSGALDHTVACPPVLPYLCWWMGEAVAMHRTAGGWRRAAAGTVLSAYGIDPGAATRTVAVLERPTRAAASRLRLRPSVGREVGMAAYLLGIVAGIGWPQGRDPDAALATATARSALATLAPGGLRRFVAPDRLTELTAAYEPLVAGAVRAGLEEALSAGERTLASSAQH